MIWIILNKLAARLLTWTNGKVVKQVNKHSQAKQPSNQPSSSISKKQVVLADYRAQIKSEPLPVETSPKPDLAVGQDVSKQLEQGSRRHFKRRSQLCLEEAEKNRDNGMPWLADMNEALAMLNEHNENTNTKQLQERANKALNRHLDLLDKEINK